MEWYLGLDLGQAADFTALAGLEWSEDDAYHLRHLERFPLGTPYQSIVDRVVELVGNPPLAGCTLAVDHTGVGRAVVDLLSQARPNARLVPVTITAGVSISADGRGGYHAPKKDLVSSLQVVLQARRLKIPRQLPLGDVLAKELGTFRVRITAAANEQFGAWREGQHDDLVLALALATWWAELCRRQLEIQREFASRPLVYNPIPSKPDPPKPRVFQIMEDLGIDPREDWD